MTNVPYLLALHSIDGLGPIRLKAIIDYFKDPKLAWESNGMQFSKLGIPKNVVTLFLETRNKLEPETYARTIQESGIKWISIYDQNYPESLAKIYDPPTLFYYKGEILSSDQNAIAIVGTRKITGYGKAVTDDFTRQLVQAGLTIVSGLARGVDSCAHLQALESDGRTIAVLGGGLNKIFPPENTRLAERIAAGAGALISEFPPDYPSLPGNFPSRNRIIAGLAKAVLVTEAAKDSGSLITARLAVEYGIDVFAVPGPVTSSLSKGPINLIQDGAKAVFDASEVLAEMGISKGGRVKREGESKLQISEEEQKVLKILENENMHLDEIGRALNFTSAKTSAILLKMEISGLVSSLGGGNYTAYK